MRPRRDTAFPLDNLRRGLQNPRKRWSLRSLRLLPSKTLDRIDISQLIQTRLRSAIFHPPEKIPNVPLNLPKARYPFVPVRQRHHQIPAPEVAGNQANQLPNRVPIVQPPLRQLPDRKSVV